ncbi:hypothetical protein MsAg5_14970 [Methanosarcinaceae archaeon Ag5]|uniref:Uncharacterized protein n=1 Tax=Methanolapillus africanus TaxID=3028297 RepID=A0AAE4MKH7_9EURY|nr:hypothetical protein [Methanosarcinaceae archaeon Ag5]
MFLTKRTITSNPIENEFSLNWIRCFYLIFISLMIGAFSLVSIVNGSAEKYNWFLYFCIVYGSYLLFSYISALKYLTIKNQYNNILKSNDLIIIKNVEKTDSFFLLAYRLTLCLSLFFAIFGLVIKAYLILINDSPYAPEDVVFEFSWMMDFLLVAATIIYVAFTGFMFYQNSQSLKDSKEQFEFQKQQMITQQKQIDQQIEFQRKDIQEQNIRSDIDFMTSQLNKFYWPIYQYVDTIFNFISSSYEEQAKKSYQNKVIKCANKLSESVAKYAYLDSELVILDVEKSLSIFQKYFASFLKKHGTLDLVNERLQKAKGKEEVYVVDESFNEDELKDYCLLELRQIRQKIINDTGKINLRIIEKRDELKKIRE